jgi:hypothetical protein
MIGKATGSDLLPVRFRPAGSAGIAGKESAQEARHDYGLSRSVMHDNITYRGKDGCRDIYRNEAMPVLFGNGKHRCEDLSILWSRSSCSYTLGPGVGHSSGICGSNINI